MENNLASLSETHWEPITVYLPRCCPFITPVFIFLGSTSWLCCIKNDLPKFLSLFTLTENSNFENRSGKMAKAQRMYLPPTLKVLSGRICCSSYALPGTIAATPFALKSGNSGDQHLSRTCQTAKKHLLPATKMTAPCSTVCCRSHGAYLRCQYKPFCQ